jgi:hypothetical protein
VQDQRSRKRMREPWSLLLQLLGLLLLLLAAAQLQWGSRERRGREHVLLVDTSAWSGQRLGSGSLLDREKSLAAEYLQALPGNDRVMLVCADSLATPATSFTLDRTAVLRAINECAPGYSALNLPQALSFARQALSWAGSRAGEVVYAGPRLVSGEQNGLPEVSNLRILDAGANRENAGIRRLAVKRSEDDPSSWQATITVKNYGATPRRLRLETQFAGTVFAPRALALSPGEETAAEYTFATNTAGELRAKLSPHDSLASDDQASLRLPTSGALRVAVFTPRTEALRPLFEANHRLRVKFYPPSGYVVDPHADVVVLDQFAPASLPKPAALWILPPRDKSPVPIKRVIESAVINNWHADAALEAGLRTKETRIANAEVFETFAGDTAIASAAEGALVVVRPKTAVIGFDPLEGDLKFELTTPLLFANLLRWLSPEAFRMLELSAGQVGACERVSWRAGKQRPHPCNRQTRLYGSLYRARADARVVHQPSERGAHSLRRSGKGPIAHPARHRRIRMDAAWPMGSRSSHAHSSRAGRGGFMEVARDCRSRACWLSGWLWLPANRAFSDTSG